MKNKKLISVRKKIDKIDYKLLNLIKIRTDLVKKVVKIKICHCPWATPLEALLGGGLENPPLIKKRVFQQGL